MKKCLTIYLTISIACLVTSCDQKSPREESERDTGTIQWVDPSTIQPGPIRRESLPDDMVERIKIVQAAFADVDPSPIENWIEDFKRDMNPDRELAIWEAMAGAYTAYNAERTLTLAKRKELFVILLTRSGSSTEDAIAHLKLKEFNETEAREAMELLAKEWEQRNRPQNYR